MQFRIAINSLMVIFFTMTGLLGCGSLSVKTEFPALDIGYDGLQQKVSHQLLAPGLSWYQVTRGQPSKLDHFHLVSGVLSDQAAEELHQRLIDAGYTPKILPLAELGLNSEPLGVQVVVGQFAEIDLAQQLADSLKESGIEMAVRFTAESGKDSSGPFVISLLELELDQYRGNLISALANETVSGAEEVSSIALRNAAVAAVNAGFFSWNESVGTIGDPAGVSIVDGKLLSEATDGRPALLIQNDSNSGRIETVEILHNLRTEIHLELDGQLFKIDGLNRTPGIVLNCGNQNAGPVKVPAHDFVCTNPHEIVLFDRHFAGTLPESAGKEFIIDAQGKIKAFASQQEKEIPIDGYLIQALGRSGAMLEKQLTEKSKAKIRRKLIADEREVELQAGLFMVNGGPTLLRNGETDLADRAREGWQTHFDVAGINDDFVDKKDGSVLSDVESDDAKSASRVGFYHSWALRRHPRTAVGITRDKRMYIAVVYGRQPGVSAGASLSDMASLLASLGAVEAINLDGGGSSVMVVNDQLTGIPSDKSGERAVGDALLLLLGSDSHLKKH